MPRKPKKGLAQSVGGDALNRPKKKKVGRPSKYNPDIHPKMAIELMSEGKSRSQVYAEIGVALSTFQEWERIHPEFQVALKEGYKLAKAWWEEKARIAVEKHDNKFPATLWMMNMTNRFGYVSSKVQANQDIRADIKQSIKVTQQQKQETAEDILNVVGDLQPTASVKDH